MRRMPKSVLIIQHVAEEPAGGIAGAIGAAGIGMRVVRVHEGEEVPDAIGEHGGLVVMGGPMSVYEEEQYPHLRRERRLLESALGARVPLLGVCLGSQLLAAALGAEVRQGARKEIGWFPVFVEGNEDPLFAATPRTFTALHWHGDVFDLPAGAVKLARSELTRCQAFCHGGFAYGVLFHLEVTGAQLAGMVAGFEDELAAASVLPADLLAGWDAHGATMESLGAAVFARWAALVATR
jgi:GMP synthase (glutamine-hydrolysing)